LLFISWSQAISSTASAWTVANPLLGWRWIFWWQAIVTLAVFILVCCFLSETRADILLIKRVKHLNKTESTKYRTEHQDEIKSFVAAAARNLTRPLKFFVTEPIVAFLALWIG
jgi:DHA1 family multidrug resistance protein-like MFS transporter